MKFGILASSKEEWHIRELRKELKKRKLESYVFPVTSLVSRISAEPRVSIKGHRIDNYDALIVRRIPGGTTEQVFYRMDSLHMLEEYGVKIINSPLSIEKSVNKYYSSALFDINGLLSPRTIVAENFREAMRGFRELGEDIVVKPIFGSLGTGITRITNSDIAYRVFRALESIKSVFYLQEFIPHNNVDIRIFVVGGKVISAMKRKGNNWKTNISSGGKPEPHSPSDEEKEVSLKAAHIFGLEYTGVDLLYSIDGNLYVLEVNSTPGWEGLQKVTEHNIASEVIEYLISELK